MIAWLCVAAFFALSALVATFLVWVLEQLPDWGTILVVYSLPLALLAWLAHAVFDSLLK